MENSAKIRILYLMDILTRFSDEDHPLATSQIIQKLEELYGISVHRTTVPKDISVLQVYGLDIVTIHILANEVLYWKAKVCRNQSSSC